VNVILVPPSDDELLSAINQYNDTLSGLGSRFYDEFKQSLELIKKTKYGWRKVGEHTRRFNIKRFPFFILYIVESTLKRYLVSLRDPILFIGSKQSLVAEGIASAKNASQ
jgi:hypothetical protein